MDDFQIIDLKTVKRESDQDTLPPNDFHTPLESTKEDNLNVNLKVSGAGDDKSFYSKHYSGHNSENLIIKQNNLKIHFSYYRINGMYFVNINGEHVFDFKRLLLIDWMTNIKYDTDPLKCDLKIKNANLGEIIIPNCNVKMFEKGVKEINQWIKKQSNIVKDIYNFVF
jgi:hypothetical protein